MTYNMLALLGVSALVARIHPLFAIYLFLLMVFCHKALEAMGIRLRFGAR